MAVYTRIAPRGPPSYPLTPSTLSRSQPPTLDPSKDKPVHPAVTPIVESTLIIPKISSLPVVDDVDETPHPSRHVSTSEPLDTSKMTSPLIPSGGALESETRVPASTNLTVDLPIQSKSITAVKLHDHGQDSPVMNETLSVIDEHITDMNSPHHSIVGAERRVGTDSGSEYSSHLDQRLSYINGEETDEEEEGFHSREEVGKWTSDQVAEYLFTAGVETKHCEVFRDQEISGGSPFRHGSDFSLP